MFQRLCYRPFVGAVGGATSAWFVGSDSIQSDRCNTTLQSAKEEGDTTRAVFRVLVVGSGLTGSLACWKIRQNWNANASSSFANTSHRVRHRRLPSLELEVAERATYPAGRFGAQAEYEGLVANLGAQVLSTVNPSDYRALGGHGVRVEDIRLADQLATTLVSEGLIERVPDEALCGTEERMIFEGLWHHYLCCSNTYTGGGGMVAVLSYLLKQAQVVSPRFGLRIDSVVPQQAQHYKDLRHQHQPTTSNDNSKSNGSILVRGIQRFHPTTTSPSKATPSELFENTYDVVVICVPAPEALRILLGNGEKDTLTSSATDVPTTLDDCFPPQASYVLKHVRYDERTCQAHFFQRDKVAPLLRGVFRNNVELNLEEGNNIEYLSWQDARRAGLGHADRNTTALVVHGATGRKLASDTVDATLSKLLGVGVPEIQSWRLFKKEIHWNPSQMISPMEALFSEPRTMQCLTMIDHDGDSNTNTNGRIILAGDYLTTSNFLGCIATANAAASVVVDVALSSQLSN